MKNRKNISAKDEIYIYTREGRKWILGKWHKIHEKGEPWPDGAFGFPPFYTPGRGPYVPMPIDSQMIQYRKCGRRRVSAYTRPETMVKSPGIDVEMRAHLVNYENRPGGDMRVNGVKFWVRKNDSESDATESCYPTYNDLMRVGESDTDSDMPLLMNPDHMHRGWETDSEFTERRTRSRYRKWGPHARR